MDWSLRGLGFPTREQNTGQASPCFKNSAGHCFRTGKALAKCQRIVSAAAHLFPTYPFTIGVKVPLEGIGAMLPFHLQSDEKILQIPSTVLAMDRLELRGTQSSEIRFCFSNLEARGFDWSCWLHWLPETLGMKPLLPLVGAELISQEPSGVGARQRSG